MLEETARVVNVDHDAIWVETQRRSTCGSCAASKGCGTAAISRVVGNRRSLVRVLASMPLKIGDEVIIGIRERALVKGSLAVYAVPIILLLLGALLGELGAQRFLWQSAEAGSLVLGISGFVAGLFWLRRFTRHIRHDADYQPVVLRKLSGHPDIKITTQ
ncbi:RseC/MucC-like positive regulator of sigma(E) [Thiogranum longum]|uniref:RseC/MucC-like positive regulator of sigma(E) n=1 Tax=Thiogranum longum TaxID=1537524 RepID=A0A4R1HBI6_9GAMM|nr:SoxR reducing system RseC family protein [Thiogranum longum]TCK17575.1 RseC/MucC-like positive regulator of sigma(E) [Thiogranum longum]